MSLGNLKKLQAAERLLKQGKTSEALEQLERLARDAPSDVLTINRMGDLLARQGRTPEAIGYYFKIARHYTSGGYLPKAIAIYKKIVRLDPKSSESLSKLGDLYLKQKLPAEAQRFLKTAAQQCEEAGDHVGAREAYEKLVRADPSNPLHRARLADAMASAGDKDSALAELLDLGDTLQRSGRGIDAEKIYRRALKLDPESAEPVLGVARALSLQDNVDGAIECLLESIRVRMKPPLLSELARSYESAGRVAETEELLRNHAEEVSEGTVADLMDLALSRGAAAGFWERLDRVFTDWRTGGHADKVGRILERLAQTEDARIPALERLERYLTESGHGAAASGVIEGLVAACRAAGDTTGAQRALERLKTVAPGSPLLETAVPAAPPVVLAATGPMPIEFETPAVPLTRVDKEFVTGRLTQAEILEKYNLVDQALQQVLEVTARFPGHVAAQRKLLGLRRSSDPTAVRDSLVSLALACRAAGDDAAAKGAAAEATELGGLDPGTEAALARLGLVAGAVLPPATPELHAAAVPMAAPPLPRSSPHPTAAPQPGAEAQDGFLIDFDAVDETSLIEPTPLAEPADSLPPASPGPGPGAAGPVRAPGPDMLAEIRRFLKQGRAREAQKGIIALESLGYGSEELDALAGQAGALLRESGPAGAPEADPGAAFVLDLDEPGSGDLGPVSEADDLSTIAAALEGEAVQPEAPLTPDAGTEQSVEEVFAAFRKAVEDEVGDDSRTHYDLAIGYKEMGLLDEAIEGFAVSARSPDLARESNMMLAICHRERGDMARAADHYRLAASMDCEDQEVRVATHYDLAEVLIQSGDDEAALDQLRRVLELDPRYRDVRQRIDDLETRLQT